MARDWNSNAVAKITAGASQDGNAAIGKAKNGIEAALTGMSATADPSATAVVSWGSGEVGYPWLDITAPGSPSTYRWQQKSSTGPTYGYRRLRGWKHILVTTPPAAIIDAAGTTAIAYGDDDKDLTSTLDGAGIQDTDWNEPLVRAVLLRVRIRFTTNTHPGGDVLYAAFREPSTTNETRIYCSSAVNVWTERDVLVGLDSTETFQYAKDTNTAGNSVALQVYLRGVFEEV